MRAEEFYTWGLLFESKFYCRFIKPLSFFVGLQGKGWSKKAETDNETTNQRKGETAYSKSYSFLRVRPILLASVLELGVFYPAFFTLHIHNITQRIIQISKENIMMYYKFEIRNFSYSTSVVNLIIDHLSTNPPVSLLFCV